MFFEAVRLNSVLGVSKCRIRILPVLMTIVLMFASALPQTGRAQSVAPVEGFADLVEAVAPSVVNISTRKDETAIEPVVPAPELPPGSPFEEFFDEFFDRDRNRERPRRTQSLGSGFVIDSSGFIVTNNHVIAEADAITVIFSDDREYEAELVGRDPKTDLALLKIEPDEPLVALEWADSDAVRVGDWMFAIGNPFGLGLTVTAGIVSARGRDIRAGPYDDFIQVDAAINRGNSGGPSFTLDGKVFGVNTAIFSPSGGNVGIGFAIPARLAKPVVDSLKNTGRVARGWLGVRIQSVTEDIAETLGLDGAEGALVASVTPGGPAAESDIAPGDVILEFDGRPIERMRDLPRIVAETPIGEEVDVVVWRQEGRRTVGVMLGELPDDAELAEMTGPDDGATSSAAPIEVLGIVVSVLNDELRQQFGISDELMGVAILEIEPGSPAEEANLQVGDLIVEVGQEPVGSVPEIMARVNQAQSEEKKTILLLLNRDGELHFEALKIE